MKQQLSLAGRRRSHHGRLPPPDSMLKNHGANGGSISQPLLLDLRLLKKSMAPLQHPQRHLQRGEN